MIISIWRATLLEPLTEEEQFLPEWEDIQIAQTALQDEFSQGEDDLIIKVKFIWGADSVDRSSAKKWDSSEFGSLVWDDNFDLAPTANQERIIKICEDLQQNSLVQD